MENINGLHSCQICNKKYKTYKSLWNHNKKFHNDMTNKTSEIILKHSDNVLKSSDITSKNYNCRTCSKVFNNIKTRWSHEQKCKTIESKNKNLEEKKLDLALKKEEARILQLKIKLQKSEKIDNVTLKKLNKLLMERNNRIKNINSHNTINNTQNNIINNFQLIGFGKEEVVETLSNKDKKLIMEARYNSLDKLIEIIHCGKYSQFKNIIITNMKDNYMYKYDDKVGHFVLSTKTDVLNSLIDYRLEDLETIYHEFLDKNKLDENTKDIIEKFINKINYIDTKYTDYEGKEHDNYKQYKINEIKILLFNNQDKITSDISLLLTTNEVTTEYKNDLTV
jgi:hypothetical protein